MGLDINTKKAKKNAFRIGKVRGEGASRFRVPGGYLNAEILGMVQEIAEKYGNGIVHLTTRQGFEIEGIHLEDMDAINEMLQLNRPDAKAVPIIAVTANAFAEDIARTTEAGMNAHIAKPIDFQLLCEILEKYSVSRGQQESPVPSRKPE